MRDVPSWDEYFINGCSWVSSRSKDPDTQVGCIVVDEDKHIIATGYNGMPPGMEESAEIWKRPTKYKYVNHGEHNSFSHATRSFKNGTMYINIWPCESCARLITSSGLNRVVVGSDYYKSDEVLDIFKRANLVFERYDKGSEKCVNLLTTNT